MSGDRRTGIGRWAKRGLLAALALLAAPYVVTLLYAVVPPPSTLMAWRMLRGEEVERRWVPLEAISPHLVRAVIASEDAQFCRHWGIDFGAIRDAIRRAEARDRPIAGTSTISMQTAKNLFLWNDRSLVRKALEAPLALWMDLVWSKRRMIEVYLNVAEWGPGVFGAEAAARWHFDVPAAQLTPDQARLLATALPNPHRRIASEPTPLQRRLAARLAARVERGGVDFSCVGRG